MVTHVVFLDTVTLRVTGYKFQQDGASVHRSRSTKTWLTTNRVPMFAEDRWPANSPDMNPIEHLWPRVTQMLGGKVFSSRSDLLNELKRCFASIDPQFVNNLYESMPRRLAALRLAKGGHTRY